MRLMADKTNSLTSEEAELFLHTGGMRTRRSGLRLAVDDLAEAACPILFPSEPPEKPLTEEDSETEIITSLAEM